jgi:hypothetical protein
MTHMTCPTPKAVLLCAIADAAGVLRCPNGEAFPPGLALDVAPLLPINPQLVELAAKFLNLSASAHLHIEQQFADPVELVSGAEPDHTLYLASLSPAAGVIASRAWPTLPDILRSLNGRTRIPYLRAWQVLAGGLQLNTKAVDAAEVAKYFDDDSL